jgi:hypothetical protein
MEPTLWVVISASTKPKSVAHNKTAVAVVAVVATVEIVVVAVVAVVAVIAVVVAVIAVVVVVTTKVVGKQLFLLDFKKARRFWWAFFCTQIKFITGKAETVADSLKSVQRVSRRCDASS